MVVLPLPPPPPKRPPAAGTGAVEVVDGCAADVEEPEAAGCAAEAPNRLPPSGGPEVGAEVAGCAVEVDAGCEVAPPKLKPWNAGAAVLV